MTTVESFVAGGWHRGEKRSSLYDPSTEEVIGESAGGADTGKALVFAREKGSPAMRALTFSQRGKMLAQASKTLHAARDALLDLAMQSGGNTRGDAKFDVDGAIGTLSFYATLGEKLGETQAIAEEVAPLSRSLRWVGTHLWTPLQGVAVHVNAFNFPAWNFLEKAAVAWLCGLPVISKPATSTSLLAHRIAQLLVDAKIFPDGAFQFVAGPTGDLLSSLSGQDAFAFTGSHDTAHKLRQQLLAGGARVNVEADSLNATVLAPKPSDDTYENFLRDVAREMTQKSGQKCTATRRIFVHSEDVQRVCKDLAERLAEVKVGNVADDKVKMGPVASAEQLRSVQQGVAALRSEAEFVFGDGGRGNVPGDKGYFVSPTLLRGGKEKVHALEVFGPVASVLSYDKDPAPDVIRGGGSLVTAIYGDDEEFVSKYFIAAASSHGRVFWGSEKTAEHAFGPGAVLPALHHGGPGRAGGGSELGGLDALRFYLQRTAFSGPQPSVGKIAERAAKWSTT